MVRIARMIGFLISAIAVQLASGIGVVALIVAALLGWRRANVLWILAPTLAGAAAALWLFEDVTSSGKVVAAQSNFVFVLIIYALICVCGYALGVVARRWR